MRSAIGIVEALQRRLSSRAQSATANWVTGITLELDDPPFSDSRDNAASRGTLRAGRREKTRDARHDILVGHHIWNQLARGRLASGDSRRRARGRRELDKRSSG